MNRTRVLVAAPLLCLLLTLPAAAQTHADYTFTTFGLPGAQETAPSAINDRGDIVGTYRKDDVWHGFLLHGGVLTTIDVPRPEATGLYINGISASGLVTGAYSTDEECVGCNGFITWHGFTWKNGAFDFFDVPDASYTIPIGINAAGDIVGECMMSDGRAYGFLLRHGLFTLLDLPRDPTEPLPWGSAYGMNAAGDIVGWYGSGTLWQFHGYVLRNGRIVTLDAPGSTWTIAYALNTVGLVVGMYLDADWLQHGFTWYKGQLATFDVPGAADTTPWGVNDLGTIVGTYHDAQGNPHGFLATKK